MVTSLQMHVSVVTAAWPNRHHDRCGGGVDSGDPGTTAIIVACRTVLSALELAAGNQVDAIEFEVRELRRLVETGSSDVAMRALDRIGRLRREVVGRAT